MSATARMEQLQRDLAQAEQAVRQAEAARAKARRDVARAANPLKEYWQEVGAGEREHEPEVERELADALARAQAAVTYRPLLSGGKLADIEAVDARSEALLAGAQRRAEDAARELQEFAAQHREAIIAERLPRSQAVGAAYAEAARAFLQANDARAAETRFYFTLDRLAFGGEDEDRWTGERAGDGLIAPPITVEATPEARALLEQGEIPRGCTPAPVWALLEPDEPEKETA